MQNQYFIRIPLLILCVFAANAAANAQHCETEFDLQQKSYFDNLIGQIPNSANRSSFIDVPVAFHILTVNGNPVYNESNLPTIISQVNDWYAPGNFGISQCGPTIFYASGGGLSLALDNVINVYITTAYSGCGVYSGLIQINPTCSLPMKEILAHEVGHALGLPHTHGYTNYGTTTELVNGTNCETHGDQFCDTPADPNILGLVNGSCAYVGTLTDANGEYYQPNTGNIMSYTNGYCRTHFSAEQHERMYEVALASNFNCCLIPVPPNQNLSTCLNTSILIDSNSMVSTVYWYDQPTGGLPFHEGASYQTGVLNQSATYYVEAFDGCSGDRAKVTVEILPGYGVLDDLPLQISTFTSSGEPGGGQGQGLGGYVNLKVHTDTLDYLIVGNNQLWSFDGSNLNMVIEIDIAGGTSVSSLTDAGGYLLLGLNDWNANQALYRSDGTAAGTVPIKIWPQQDYEFSNYWLTALGAQNLFVLTSADNMAELWSTDGTEVGTFMLYDLNFTSGYNAFDFVALDGLMFFSAFTSSGNRELWRTDGTAGGTGPFADLNPATGSNPDLLAVVNGYLYFSANDGVSGAELWRTDANGPPASVSDINPSGGSNIAEHLVSGNELIFTATDGINGSELWRTDGTPAGTVLLADLNTSGSSSPGRYCMCQGKVFFGAAIVTGEHHALFAYDPQNGSVELIKRPGQSGYGGMEEMYCSNGTLFFRAANTGYNFEIWRSNGTADGTFMTGEIHPSPTSGSYPSKLFGRNNQIFFMASNGTTGQQLWTLTKTQLGFCQGDDALIQTGNSTGLVHWYADVQMDTLVHTGFSFLIPNIQETDTLWVVLESGGCLSEQQQLIAEVFAIDSLSYSSDLCVNETSLLAVHVSDAFENVTYVLDFDSGQTSGYYTGLASGEHVVQALFESCTVETEFQIEQLQENTWFQDFDTDNFGSLTLSINSCYPIQGHILMSGDCDDTNNAVYPGAPGTSEGVDNNCNGQIDTGENLCQGDLNGDQMVNFADIFLFLGNYGCTSNCFGDLNFDGFVNTSDLFFLLTFYGTSCN